MIHSQRQHNINWENIIRLYKYSGWWLDRYQFWCLMNLSKCCFIRVWISELTSKLSNKIYLFSQSNLSSKSRWQCCPVQCYTSRQHNPRLERNLNTETWTCHLIGTKQQGTLQSRQRLAIRKFVKVLASPGREVLKMIPH